MGNVCGNWVKGEWNWVWQMGQKARWSEFVSGNGRIKKKRGGASVGRDSNQNREKSDGERVW